MVSSRTNCSGRAQDRGTLMLYISSHSRRYSCLFSCLFNNVSRDATLALSGVLCSQLGDDAGSHDAPASVW